MSRNAAHHHQIENDKIEGPHGWVQWKGTDVCIDLHCSCGHHGHFDGEFFYFYECRCGKKYAVGANVKLVELPANIAAGMDETDFKYDIPN